MIDEPRGTVCPIMQTGSKGSASRVSLQRMVGVPELPKPGDVLAGKYEIVRLLGKGGMGAVFEAKHLRLQQRVAVKVLKPELLLRSDCVMRFEREGRAVARLTCANVARVFDVDSTEAGLPFLVIEYLEGHDLLAELGTRDALEVPEAVDLLLQACSAMSEAHALGIVHRDLKPANLFLCGKSRRKLKVLDFGISKVLADDAGSSSTASSTALGTPHYMSPEQIVTASGVDARSDIWSLGVILYRLLSGRLPFVGDSPMALVLAIGTKEPRTLEDCAKVPPALADAVMKALAKEPSDRWQRVEDFAYAIEPFGTGTHPFEPVASSSAARAPSPAAQPSPPSSPAGDETQGTAAGEAQATMENWTHVETTAPRPRASSRVAKVAAVVVALACALVVARFALVTKPVSPAKATEPVAAKAPILPTAELPAPSVEPSPRAATSTTDADAGALSGGLPRASPAAGPRKSPARPSPPRGRSSAPSATPPTDPAYL
jgi:eukaryotic-like serine/threonine-protein kinase